MFWRCSRLEPRATWLGVLICNQEKTVNKRFFARLTTQGGDNARRTASKECPKRVHRATQHDYATVAFLHLQEASLLFRRRAWVYSFCVANRNTRSSQLFTMKLLFTYFKSLYGRFETSLLHPRLNPKLQSLYFHILHLLNICVPFFVRNDNNNAKIIYKSKL